MAQTTVNFRTDADLKRDFERLCRDIGMNLTTAMNIIMKQSVRKNKILVDLEGDPFYSESNMARIDRAIEELEAGFGIEMTDEEFEAYSDEPIDGPVHQEIERRRQEMRAKKLAWEAAKKNG